VGLDLDARHDRDERRMIPAAATILADAGVPVTPDTLRAGKIWPEIAFRLARSGREHTVTLAHTDGRTSDTTYDGPHALRRATGYIARLKRGEQYPSLTT
jgi:hypothetical protein